MEEIQILDAIERYIQGEMSADEKLQFEQLRKNNDELDQMVVEHSLFLQQMNRLGNWQMLRANMNEVHSSLAEEGKVDNARHVGTSKIVYLWERYKRVAAIAACIAGITALSISALAWAISPKTAVAASDIQNLKREIKEAKNITNKLAHDLAYVKGAKADASSIAYKTVGTGFFIDPSGLMITNAHVVSKSKNITVFNQKGDRFNAVVVTLDELRDVAIIKIDDEHFKTFHSLPYGISNQGTDLAESVFTLGYPRDEVVYGEGYLSAKTGHNGDTLSCQVFIPANPGNSGGPVFNRRGEVIGILSAKETHAEGAVFAVQSKYIYQAMDELRKNNSSYKNHKLPTSSALNGLSKIQQVKKIQDFVFMVKAD